MIFAAFAVSMAMCVPFAACGGEGESDQTVDQVQTMVEDEETWDAAFADLDYVNFSIRVHYVSDIQGTVDNYLEISENAIYYNVQDVAECYTAKNDDGTYSNYFKNTGEENYTLLNDTSDYFFVLQRRAIPRPISLADYFEMFTYDEDTKTYRCADEISCKFIGCDYEGNETELGIICSNIVVATENNLIVSISADYSVFNNQSTKITNAHFEYFNIGRTTVTIPQEVIDNAVAEEIDSGENTPADGNGDSGDNNIDSAENLG